MEGNKRCIQITYHVNCARFAKLNAKEEYLTKDVMILVNIWIKQMFMTLVKEEIILVQHILNMFTQTSRSLKIL